MINFCHLMAVLTFLTKMLTSLGWKSLGNQCYDARLAILYKIVHGLFAIPVPPYFEQLTKYTHDIHSLSFK